jgi:hypothetical protein
MDRGHRRRLRGFFSMKHLLGSEGTMKEKGSVKGKV